MGELTPYTKQCGGVHTFHRNMVSKNLYVTTILPSYFNSWETWKD